MQRFTKSAVAGETPMAADDPTPGESDEERLKRLRREYIATDKTGNAMATAGIELGLTFAVLALGGWWIDKKLGTSPWLLLLGCFIGIVGGLIRLVRRSNMMK